MFGRKVRQASAEQSAGQDLTIALYHYNNQMAYTAKCPFGKSCPDSPRPGSLPGIVMGLRSWDDAEAAMNAHLYAVHQIEPSVPRKVVRG